MSRAHINKCIVSGCENSSRHLEEQKKRICLIHEVTYKECSCPLPFKLFSVPNVETKPEEYSRLCQLINRRKKDAPGLVLWQPGKTCKVCSLHYQDGHPSERYPYPTLHMGYGIESFNPLLRLPAWATNIRTVKKTKESQKPEDQGPGEGDPPAAFLPEEEPTLPARVTKRLQMPSGEKGARFAKKMPSMKRLLETGLQNIATSSESEAETAVRPPKIVKVNITDSDLDLLKPAASDSTSTDSGPRAAHSAEAGPGYTPKPDVTTPQANWMEILKENEKLRKQLDLKDKSSTACRSSKSSTVFDLKTDEGVRFYTGLPNVNILDAIWDLIKPAALRMRSWSEKTPAKRGKIGTNRRNKAGVTRKLTLFDQFIMTLVRLRLGYLEQDLAYHYGVNKSTVSRILSTWVKFLSRALAPMVRVPPNENIRAAMPDAFLRTPKVTHIIDCTEIFIERSKDPEVQAMTWSNYKHHNTVKVLVDITPNGYIQYVSKAYVGRISDLQLVRDCDWLQFLEPNDVVMADRGFPIREELAQRLCDLYIPQGKRGVGQFTEAQVDQIKSVANTRIFVEQAIQRIKEFRFLKFEVPLSASVQISDAVMIASAITNLGTPLCT